MELFERSRLRWLNCAELQGRWIDLHAGDTINEDSGAGDADCDDDDDDGEDDDGNDDDKSSRRR